MTPVLYTSPEDCCACRVCSNVCPKNAIAFKEDMYGFLFPTVDESLCVGCGKCESVCNFHNNTIDYRREPIKGYAAVLRHRKILKNSVSGGVFWAMAEWIIQKGGCVFGCVWDDEMNPVHVCAETMEQLLPMQGSKYVQSDVGNSYQQVKRKLDEGRFVLFTGTPCQVAALRSFLNKKSYEKLFTVDLVCHGVPNNLFFHQYLTLIEKQYQGKVVDFHFRHKRPDWLNGCVWMKIKKGNRYITKELFHVECLYFGCFSPKNLSCRLSCASCKYSCSKRIGDLTIGDFWGYKNSDIKLHFQDGLSCVLVNDNRLLPIIEELNLNLQEVPIDAIIQGNAQLRHPFPKDEKWELVMDAVSKNNLEKVARMYNEDNYSIIRRSRLKRMIPPKLLAFLKEMKYK